MNKLLKPLEWLGTIASVIGSFVVALGMLKIGYSLFILGSVCWLIAGIATKNVALYVLNGFFLLANLIGIYRAFL